MRRVVLLLVSAIAGGADAAPAAPPATAWADWVGDWTGKLTWTGCTSDGAPSATLSIDASDGAMAIDLAPAGVALGAMSLIDDGGNWMGQQADVTVRVSRATTGVLDVAVELDSGCRMRGALKRTSTGIAACDRLVGWARVEARCTKLVRPPLEVAPRLARQRETWSSAKGVTERSKIAAQCETRASRVEAQLVDAGCAPYPDPEIGIRGAQCQAVRQIAARFARCSAPEADLKAVVSQAAAQLSAAVQTADGATLPMVEAQCRELSKRIATESRIYGCPP
jgi:hypothetical protein